MQLGKCRLAGWNAGKRSAVVIVNHDPGKHKQLVSLGGFKEQMILDRISSRALGNAGIRLCSPGLSWKFALEASSLTHNQPNM